MRNATYVYFFKLDLNQEAIGNVMASSINEAREKIAVIKQYQLMISIGYLLSNKKRGNHENDL